MVPTRSRAHEEPLQLKIVIYGFSKLGRMLLTNTSVTVLREGVQRSNSLEGKHKINPELLWGRRGGTDVGALMPEWCNCLFLSGNSCF